MNMHSLFISLSALFGFVSIAQAVEEYVLLSDLPGLRQLGTSSGDFAGIINGVYNMSIGLGSVIAVFIIVYSGIRIAASDSTTLKSELKERIVPTIGGLCLLISAYIFLTFINPDLIKFDGVDIHVKINYDDVEGFEFGVTNIAINPNENIKYYNLIIDGKVVQNFKTKQACEDAQGSIGGFCELVEISTPKNSPNSFANIAIHELNTYGQYTENNPIMCDQIQKYAQIVGNSNWDCTDNPWSAIFISYVMIQGGRNNFPVSTAHREYIQEAKQGNFGLTAHHPGQYKPRLGDLICKNRNNEDRKYINVTFDTILNHDSYPSHCDIVIRTGDSDNPIIAIGGNVGNKVSRVVYNASGGIPTDTNLIATISIR